MLTKAGGLDEGELAEIRTHPVEGVWLIAGVPSLHAALPYMLFHHERWDGTATRRASGRGDPARGRMLAVADAFDAMTSVGPIGARSHRTRLRRRSGAVPATSSTRRVASAFLDALEAGEILLGRHS